MDDPEVRLAVLTQQVESLQKELTETKATLWNALNKEVAERKQETKDSVNERKSEFRALRTMVYSIFGVLALYGWENIIK